MKSEIQLKKLPEDISLIVKAPKWANAQIIHKAEIYKRTKGSFKAFGLFDHKEREYQVKKDEYSINNHPLTDIVLLKDNKLEQFKEARNRYLSELENYNKIVARLWDESARMTRKEAEELFKRY